MSDTLIRTPDQRLRVFVSSTLAELAGERTAVREAIEALHLTPVMFELGARPYPPREVYRAYLEQSHIFVGIYWQRYGWVAPGESVSGLEDEYILSQGMPRLLYVKAPAPEREDRLDELLGRIRDEDTASYRPFASVEELARLVGADLALLLSERFSRPRAPTGVVTFLVTDAGSRPDAQNGVRDHDGGRGAITSHNGYAFTGVSGELCGAFARPLDAVMAVSGLLQALQAADRKAADPSTFRMALHSGAAEVRDGGYAAPSLAHALRLLTVAHGGQVLLSAAVVELLGNDLPDQLELRSLGVHRLADVTGTEVIHQLVAPGWPSDFPPLRTVDQRRHNLPARLSSFVGREQELANVKRALGDSRLVTLTGVGGSGKSSLALVAAAELVRAFPNGAWLAELARVTDGERVPSAIASALRIPENPQLPILETLSSELQSKRLLLVVDNCEHVLAACAQLAETLLQAAPEIRILATSREALRVPGELSLPVPPLPVPQDTADTTSLVQFAAVQLFVERTMAVRPELTVNPTNAASIVEIVTRLDGIPLAIELAAARVRLLSIEQIATRLADRFRLLTGGASTAQARQQTLRAAMDWSYDLLAPEEQTLLRRLSIFSGGWTVEAAETVCPGSELDPAAVLDLLGRLVDKSLVSVLPGGVENRFQLLQTVREYGLERLIEAGERERAREAHRDWCSATVAAAAPQLRGGVEQAHWLERLESEHDDIQAALEWSLRSGDVSASLRIADGMAWFWYLRGHWSLADRLLEQSIALDGAEPTLRARADAWSALFAWRRGDLERASQHAQASLAVLTGTVDDGEGRALLVSALVAISRAELEQAAAYAQRALEVFRALHRTWGVSTSLMVLAHVAINRNSGEAMALLQESSALLASGSDRWGRGHVLSMLGSEAMRALDLEQAAEHHRASHAIAVGLGDRASQAENLLALGHVHLLRGQAAEAAEVLATGRDLVERLNDRHELAHVDLALALLAVSQGRVGDAEAKLQDVARLILDLGRAQMGRTYAVSMAELYRRAGRPLHATVLLGHALSFLDRNESPVEYEQICQQLAAVGGEIADREDSTLSPGLCQE